MTKYKITVKLSTEELSADPLVNRLEDFLVYDLEQDDDLYTSKGNNTEYVVTIDLFPHNCEALKEEFINDDLTIEVI